MQGRDKKVVIGVGVSLIFSVAFYFYNSTRERDLVENAKYKAVAGGLENSMRKMEESAKKKPESEPAKVASKLDGPKDIRSLASLPPSNAPVVPFKDEVHLSPPTQAYVPPPAEIAHVPPSGMELKIAELATSESSMYLRYKEFLLRVNLKKGIKIGSPQINGFSGQKVETIVSDDSAAECANHCYQLSEKLVGQLREKKTARALLKTQGWFLVSDQDSQHCNETSLKKLTVTQDIEGKCMIGMLSEGRTIRIAEHDSRAQLEVTSVMIMQKVAAREPASEN